MRLPIVAAAIALLGMLPVQAQEWRVNFSMCGRDRTTCVVDGDTIWLQGVNLRLESYDTPEPYNDICGGQAEVALAKRASARLLQPRMKDAIGSGLRPYSRRQPSSHDPIANRTAVDCPWPARCGPHYEAYATIDAPVALTVSKDTVCTPIDMVIG